MVVGDGGQEAGRGADREGTLGQVWTPLLLQVKIGDSETSNSSFIASQPQTTWVYRYCSRCFKKDVMFEAVAPTKTIYVPPIPSSTCCPDSLSCIPILNSPSWELHTLHFQLKFPDAEDSHLPTETFPIPSVFSTTCNKGFTYRGQNPLKVTTTFTNHLEMLVFFPRNLAYFLL